MFTEMQWKDDGPFTGGHRYAAEVALPGGGVVRCFMWHVRDGGEWRGPYEVAFSFTHPNPDEELRADALFVPRTRHYFDAERARAEAQALAASVYRYFEAREAARAQQVVS